MIPQERPRCPKCRQQLDAHSKGDWWCKVCFKRWWMHAGALIDRETLKRLSQ